MSGREFLTIWAISLSLTGAVVGWAFAVQCFGLPVVAEVLLGVGLPLAVVMGVTWLGIRG